MIVIDTLPDKWCIKTYKNEEGKIIGRWFDKQSKNIAYRENCLGEYYHSYNLQKENIMHDGNLAASFANYSIREGYSEITFEQFKKYVLKESIEEPKEIIPEYVEYIKSDDVGKIVKVLKWSTAFYCKVEFPNGTIKEPFKHLVKPSTKEAFDAQNKHIEKWSVGSYVVFLKDYLQNNGRKKGDISKITKIIK